MIRLGNEHVREKSRNPTGNSLRNFEDNKPQNDGPKRRMELESAEGPVRVRRREGFKISVGDTQDLGICNFCREAFPLL
jgi:hypothetical protein